MTTRCTRLRRALLAWYDRSKRDLPWRADRDPYRVWLSEVMLQQTRVETVIPYFESFLERYPTLSDLACAPLEDVMSMWSGLGYYRRIRHFHAAVREVHAEYAGTVPDDPDVFRSLPGVGEYTAAAVQSIAFSKRMPLIDGNVERVMARLLAHGDNVKTRTSHQVFRRELEALLSPRRPGDFNQALMELGATVCVPRRPMCDACPWRSDCLARAQRREERLPVLPERKNPINVNWLTIVPVRGAEFWLVQRPEGGLMPGLWNFPTLEGLTWNRLRRGKRVAGLPPVFRLAREATRACLGPRRGMRHHVMNRRIDVDVIQLPLERSRSRRLGGAGQWTSAAQIARLPVCGLTKKIVADGTLLSP